MRARRLAGNTASAFRRLPSIRASRRCLSSTANPGNAPTAQDGSVQFIRSESQQYQCQPGLNAFRSSPTRRNQDGFEAQAGIIFERGHDRRTKSTAPLHTGSFIHASDNSIHGYLNMYVSPSLASILLCMITDERTALIGLIESSVSDSKFQYNFASMHQDQMGKEKASYRNSRASTKLAKHLMIIFKRLQTRAFLSFYPQHEILSLHWELVKDARSPSCPEV